MYQLTGTTIAPIEFKDVPVDHVLGPSQRYYLEIRSVLEQVLAGIMLVLCVPIIALAALWVKCTSRGPIFYSQIRLGEGGRPYPIYKLRTMQDKCELKSGPRWATANDPRVTVAGRFLRKTHIDELPQLWNVLRGDMSLIGPRPERPEFVPALEQAIPNYRERLLVRPGVTGLAQLILPADTDLESARRKVVLDRFYVHHLNWWMDVRLLLGTPFYLLGVPRDFTRRALGMPDVELARCTGRRDTVHVGIDATVNLTA